jgi:hypothetical protein
MLRAHAGRDAFTWRSRLTGLFQFTDALVERIYLCVKVIKLLLLVIGHIAAASLDALFDDLQNRVSLAPQPLTTL